MRIPVLTYHALHASGATYEDNDHVALAEDLSVIRACGFRVVRLRSVVDALLGEAPEPEGNCVAITFDDAPDFDWRDLHRPELGLVPSFARILEEAASPAMPRSRLPPPTATSFVIASPGAREVMDRTCIAGLGEWNDDWWADAHRQGTVEIANHSWDHTHESLPAVAQRHQQKGNFYGVDNYDDADAQIRRAEDYIESKLGGASARIFAYPYGGFVEYLCREYLPNFQHEHRQRAAVTTHDEFVTEGSDRWKITRFVCNWHWKDPDGLRYILQSAKPRMGWGARLGARIRALAGTD